MAYLISDDTDYRAVHASMYGLMTKADASFLREKVTRSFNRAKGYASAYLKEAMDVVSSLDIDRLKDSVEAVKDRFGKRWDADTVVPVAKLGDLQQAKHVMRRWIMADLRARTLFHGDKISGYGGKFYDSEDRRVGRELPDYRRVMQGAEIGPEYEDQFITYFDELDDEDALRHEDRVIIRHAWQQMWNAFDEGGQDPTSPNKNLL